MSTKYNNAQHSMHPSRSRILIRNEDNFAFAKQEKIFVYLNYDHKKHEKKKPTFHVKENTIQ